MSEEFNQGIKHEDIENVINKEHSLNELLGDDWKDKCLFDNMKEYLDEEELILFTQEDEISEMDTECKVRMSSINTLLEIQESPFRIKVCTDSKGNEQILMTGKIGEDIVFQTIKKHSYIKAKNGDTVYALEPLRIGVLSSDYSVLGLDNILEEEKDRIKFVVKEGDKFTASEYRHSTEGKNTIYTSLPYDIKDFGTFMHEIGHLVREKKYKENGKEHEVSFYMGWHIGELMNGGDLHRLDAILTNYEARKLLANEERGAWAFVLSLLKECHNEKGFHLGSREVLSKIAKDAEKKLSTYDRLKYSLKDMPEDAIIPGFSNAAVQASRELKKQMDEKKITYKNLPNFDDQTGKNLSNDPRQLLEYIKNNY